MEKRAVFWGVAGLVLFLDQLVKWIIQQTMQEGQSIAVIDSIFHLTYILNPGAAFGLFAYQTWMLILLAFIVLVAVGVFYHKIMAQSGIVRFALSLELGGTLGNLLDRIRLGSVVDYLDFRIWPIFNIADMAIVSGVAFFLYYLIFIAEEAEKKYGEI